MTETKNGNKRGGLTAFARKAEISPTYAFEIETGKKTPPLETAARIYKRTGRKFGALKVADTREANTVVRVLQRAGQLAA
jgi:transcriptional regulator with XRE-family HTH domain